MHRAGTEEAVRFVPDRATGVQEQADIASAQVSGLVLVTSFNTCLAEVLSCQAKCTPEARHLNGQTCLRDTEKGYTERKLIR